MVLNLLTLGPPEGLSLGPPAADNGPVGRPPRPDESFVERTGRGNAGIMMQRSQGSFDISHTHPSILVMTPLPKAMRDITRTGGRNPLGSCAPLELRRGKEMQAGMLRCAIRRIRSASHELRYLVQRGHAREVFARTAQSGGGSAQRLAKRRLGQSHSSLPCPFHADVRQFPQ